MTVPEGSELSIEFDERSPRRILEDRMKEGTSALPRLLERCSAVALMGVAGFAIALILAITSGTSGAAIAVMLVSSVAILASMIVATFVSARQAQSTHP